MGHALAKASLQFDTGPSVGLGHKRRLEALARALADLGVDCRVGPVHGARGGDLVVVDSYRHRADDRARFQARVLAVVDDLGRDEKVDVLVDPTPGTPVSDGRSARVALVGASYALVDPAFDELRPKPVGNVTRLLVTTGGADVHGYGAKIARSLRQALPATHIWLVLGPWSHPDVPFGIDPVRTQQGLGPFLAAADLVITGGGVSMLESLHLGRPTVGMALHANQRRAVEGVVAAGAAVAATVDQAAAVAAELAEDLPMRIRLSREASRLVDGQGARRVARCLLELL